MPKMPKTKTWWLKHTAETDHVNSGYELWKVHPSSKSTLPAYWCCAKKWERSFPKLKLKRGECRQIEQIDYEDGHRWRWAKKKKRSKK